MNKDFGDITNLARDLLFLPRGKNKQLMWDLDILTSHVTKLLLAARLDEIQQVEVNPLNKHGIITFINKFSGQSKESRINDLEQQIKNI